MSAPDVDEWLSRIAIMRSMDVELAVGAALLRCKSHQGRFRSSRRAMGGWWPGRAASSCRSARRAGAETGYGQVSIARARGCQSVSFVPR